MIKSIEVTYHFTTNRNGGWLWMDGQKDSEGQSKYSFFFFCLNAVSGTALPACPLRP